MRLHSNRFYSCAVQCDATISCKREQVLRVIIIIIIIIIILEYKYIYIELHIWRTLLGTWDTIVSYLCRYKKTNRKIVMNYKKLFGTKFIPTRSFSSSSSSPPSSSLSSSSNGCKTNSIFITHHNYVAHVNGNVAFPGIFVPRDSCSAYTGVVWTEKMQKKKM